MESLIPGERSGKSSKSAQKGHGVMDNSMSQPFSSAPNRHQTFSNDASADIGAHSLVNK